MRAARTAFLLLPLLLTLSCPSVRPANEQRIAELERCAKPEDQARLEEARNLIDQGRHRSALQILRSLLRTNPACGRLHILARRAVGLAPEAERNDLILSYRTLLGELRKQNPTNKSAVASLAFGSALFAQASAQEEAWLLRALKADPDHYYALALRGEQLWSRGDLERARELLTRSVRLRKNLAESWLLLARVAEDRGLYRTADRHYQAYLGLRPLDRRVKLNHARLLVHNLREGKRAQPIVEELARANPSDLEVGLLRALVYFRLEQWEATERAYQELLRRYPREPRVVLSLGNLYFGRMKNLSKALVAYRYLVSLASSSDPQTMVNQFLFVPSRIKDIEAKLKEKGQEVPAATPKVEDLLGT